MFFSPISTCFLALAFLLILSFLLTLFCTSRASLRTSSLPDFLLYPSILSQLRHLTLFQLALMLLSPTLLYRVWLATSSLACSLHLFNYFNFLTSLFVLSGYILSSALDAVMFLTASLSLLSILSSHSVMYFPNFSADIISSLASSYILPHLLDYAISPHSACPFATFSLIRALSTVAGNLYSAECSLLYLAIFNLIVSLFVLGGYIPTSALDIAVLPPVSSIFVLRIFSDVVICTSVLHGGGTGGERHHWSSQSSAIVGFVLLDFPQSVYLLCDRASIPVPPRCIPGTT